MLRLVFMHDQFCVLEYSPAGVPVGQQDGINVVGCHSGCCEVLKLLARAGLHERAAAGFHQSRLSAGMDEECIDCCAPSRPQIRRENILRFASVYVAEYFEIAV